MDVSMNKLRAPVCVLALAAAAAGQTNRTMHLLTPPQLGQTTTFAMAYPPAAAGNVYAFLWSTPPFAGTATIALPGLTVRGVARINPNSFVSAFSGLLDASGTVSHSVAVPNAAPFLGYAWDLQSIDLAVAAGELLFADNDLSMVVWGSNPLTNFVRIPPGAFQMGSNAAAGTPYYSHATQRPVHQVTISWMFWIGRYEVTQAEYRAVMGTNPSRFQGPSWNGSANFAVETVSWVDAMAFCAALTAREAAAGRLPTGYQYRLPTEAEWEFCCRAGTTTEFHYGPSLDCSQANIASSNHTSGSCYSPFSASVGLFAPNAWGLFDMHGNMAEWCLDGWDGSANYPSAAVVDPYVSSGPVQMTRGGSWGDSSASCRSAYRRGSFPSFRNDYFGFRVVLAPVLVP